MFKRFSINSFLTFLLIIAIPDGNAATLLWQDAGMVSATTLMHSNQHSSAQRTLLQTTSSTTTTATMPPLHYRQWHVNETQLRKILTADNSEILALNLPLPDGNQAAITATRTHLLAPELAARYPTIQTWAIQGTHDHRINGVMTLNTQGLHAALHMPNQDRLFITPLAQTSLTTAADNQKTYQSISQRTNLQAQTYSNAQWSCASHTSDHAQRRSFTNTSSTALRSAARRQGELRTFRLAVTATSSYAQTHGGGTLEGTLSAIVAAVNQINFIFKRDLGIQFQLVADNDKIIFVNEADSPFDENNLRSTMLRNQAVLDQRIGNANYDIGHVFNGSGGGIAVVGSTCQNTIKAKGATGLGRSATESLFAIDYAAHEIGHQLSALHTFNSAISACSGGRTADNAYEPGSGSTIMAYAGLCAIDNLSTRSLPQFHSKSIEQITRYIEQDAGLSCGIKQATSNQNPSINAGSDYTIPARTPFTLSALTSSDNDGDNLTYSWEQLDAGTASNVNVDTRNNAIIRVASLSNTAQRSIPTIHNFLSGTLPAGEVLPASSRTLNFRLQARDQNGGLAHDDAKINVHNTGTAFAVTFPQHAHQLVAGQPLAVTWHVANTHLAPIHCSHVDIAVTDNQGQSFTSLLRNSPNNGNATVRLPTTLGNSAHIRVKCSNNIFFALSGTQAPIAKYDATTANNNTNTTNTNSGNTGVTTTEANNEGSGGGGKLSLFSLITLLMLIFLQLRFANRSHNAHA